MNRNRARASGAPPAGVDATPRYGWATWRIGLCLTSAVLAGATPSFAQSPTDKTDSVPADSDASAAAFPAASGSEANGDEPALENLAAKRMRMFFQKNTYFLVRPDRRPVKARTDKGRNVPF